MRDTNLYTKLGQLLDREKKKEAKKGKRRKKIKTRNKNKS